MSENEPIPPGCHKNYAGHHWLERIDIDGRRCGLTVLQWNPKAQKWTFSNMVATDSYIDTRGWVYVAECPLPKEAK